jgi:hypothetical protein
MNKISGLLSIIIFVLSALGGRAEAQAQTSPCGVNTNFNSCAASWVCTSDAGWQPATAVAEGTACNLTYQGPMVGECGPSAKTFQGTVSVSCERVPSFTISVTVSGLTGGTLELQDNGVASLSIEANGTFTFPSQIATGKRYGVTVKSPPAGQNCILGSNDSGMVDGANVDVEVTCRQIQSSGLQVRMRWQDFVSGPDGAKRLASLTAAVAKMKSLDCSAPNTPDYRRSWQYWANIHGYYGPQSPDGTLEAQIQNLQSNGMGSDVSYYQGITDQTPPDATAQAIWATCQHSGSSQAVNFFGWHRMYLYYFERVLRWAANDDTLRLPYWDYTDLAQVALPAEFRNLSSTLYDCRRNPGINNDTSTLSPNSTDVDSLLGQTVYFTYESGIEEGIHGYVHCTVGPDCPVAHMGDVPVAANDPIFYEHHANIDRLWACWQNLHPTPAGAWQNQQFQFVDETGTLQTQPVSSFLDSTSLGYVYDNVNNCSRAGASGPSANATSGRLAIAQGETRVTVLGAAGNIRVTHPQTSVDINIPEANLRTLFAQPKGSAATELVLRDVTAQSPPGVLFDVYIATKNEPTVREFVGTISWFGVFRHHGNDAPVKRTLQFDVTRQLKKLRGSANASGFTVTIEATTGRVQTDSSQAKEMTSEALQAFRSQANVQIGAIELQQSVVLPEKH